MTARYRARTVFTRICCALLRSLQWRHNDHDSVSNHQHHGCLLNRLFGRRSKKTSKLRVTGLCAGNSPGPVNSPHKGPVTRKMFPFDDVIMFRVYPSFSRLRVIPSAHIFRVAFGNRPKVSCNPTETSLSFGITSSAPWQPVILVLPRYQGSYQTRRIARLLHSPNLVAIGLSMELRHGL